LGIELEKEKDEGKNCGKRNAKDAKTSSSLPVG